MKRAGFSILFFLLGVSLISPHIVFSAPTQKPTRVELQTKDGVVLIGNYTKVPDTKAVVILLPMLSKTKASWTGLAKILQDNQFSSFAVDLRGHGESISQNGREISWRTFSNPALKKIILDIEAVYQFLVEKEKIAPSRIFVCGASIGANLALEFATDHEMRGLLIFSPGMDYRGITPELAAKKYGDRPIFYAASREDMSSFEATRILARYAPHHAIVELENAGHGTEMLMSGSVLTDPILTFLNEYSTHPSSGGVEVGKTTVS